MSSKIITRYTVKPTSRSFDLSECQTMLVAYLQARHHQGDFHISLTETISSAYWEILDWLGISWKSVINQADHKNIYLQFAYDLIDKGHAYPCVDSVGKLRGSVRNQNPTILRNLLDQEKLPIRFAMPDNQMISCHDYIKGVTKHDTNNINDPVIVDAERNPSQMFKDLVDDVTNKVNVVILNSASDYVRPLHSLMCDAIGYKSPFYATLPVIKQFEQENMNHVRHYYNMGIIPNALVQSLCCNKTITHDANDITDRFSINEMAKPKVITPDEILRDSGNLMNNESSYSIALRCLPHAQKLALQEPICLEDWSIYMRLIMRMRAYITCYSEVLDEIGIFFRVGASSLMREISQDPNNSKIDVRKILNDLIVVLKDVNPWNYMTLRDCVNTLVTQYDIAIQHFHAILRKILSRSTAKTKLTTLEVIEILGKEETLAKLESAVSRDGIIF